MIKLQKPKIDIEKLANVCIDTMNRGDRKNRLVSSKQEIVENSKNYDIQAQREALSSFVEHDSLESGATKDDMTYLYDKRLVQGPGRKYYDMLMLLSPNKRCPYCGQRNVSTLDHYLPKSKYPGYAITEVNLIPACSECNHLKLDKVIHFREEEVIHPYYDDFSSDEWLAAKVIEKDPIGFEFFVDAPDEWEEEKVIRAKKHFEVFELNRLYQLNSAEEFVPCFSRIKRIYKKSGIEAAIEGLKDDIEDRKELRKNTWQAAMYNALIESEWFWKEFLPMNIS